MPQRPELLVVSSLSTKGWILDRICREVHRSSTCESKLHYCAPVRFRSSLRWTTAAESANIWEAWPLPRRIRSRFLPFAKTYFFPVPDAFQTVLRFNPHLRLCRTVVFYTHCEALVRGQESALSQIRLASFVITMNKLDEERLVRLGWPDDRVATVLCGSDPELFKPHTRAGGAVGLCSAFYPRKAPDFILQVVRALPHRRFVLLGRGWESWKKFDELTALPNFQYRTAPYQDYPQWYSEIDVFLSPSKLEGGPIPLLEAMMSNCVPVASRTGFAPDLIRHGENGFLFDVDTSVSEVAGLVEEAYSHRRDVRETIVHLTWQRFAKGLSPYLCA